MSQANSLGREGCLSEPRLVQWLLIALTLVFLSIFLIVPLVVVFSQALSKGFEVYWAAISHEEALSAIKLTILAAVVSVSLNLIFGLCAAWLITKFEFRGKSLLLTIIDLPLAISPVVVGLLFVLLFGSNGWFAGLLSYLNLKIIFAVPGIILVTTFITLPFIARELIPLMQEQGNTEEESALTMGANGWQTFFYITLPKIKWGLLYGVILCNARAMGEFGAVSVVSGHVRGLTNTMPLEIEILYNEYQFAAAFAIASLLAFLALLTIMFKSLLEWQMVRAQN